MKTNHGGKYFPRTLKRALNLALVIAGLLFSIDSFAQGGPPLPTPPPGRLLNVWEFDTNTWRGAWHVLPISFTNIDQVEDWSGTALQVDSTNAAWLQYHVVENNNHTNLMCTQGTVRFWFLPNWLSNDTNQNGTGPRDYGRFIDVGTWTNDASLGWWSLYLNSDGTSITFSSQDDGQGTNYLSAPISWDSSTWHLISLTYSVTNTALYIDGELAASGDGVLYVPNASVLTNGFFVGSDKTGNDQIHGQMDALEIYNYQLDPTDIADDFNYENPNLTLTVGTGGTHTTDSGGMFPGGGDTGGGNTSTNTPNNQPYNADYGANLCIIQQTIVSNCLNGIVSNTQPNILYEIQGRSDLIQGDWISYGFFNGSELANWSPSSVPASTSSNLFLRIRSWQDTTGTGIPDWWWLKHFGQTTNVDASTIVAGDGLNNWQKFQLGINPNNYYNPNAPAVFFGCPDATGTNMVLEWSPSPGPVLYYLIQKSTYDDNWDLHTTNIIVSSNTTFYVDRGEIIGQHTIFSWSYWQYDEYALQAVYADGSTTASNLWYVDYAYYADPFFFTNYSLPTVAVYVDTSSNNVTLSWTPPPWPPNNYIIERVVYNAASNNYTSTPIAQVGSNATSFVVSNAIQYATNWSDLYAVSAGYPGGGQTPVFPYNNYGEGSNPSVANISIGSPTADAGPPMFYGYKDATGTNLYLIWNPASGSVINYLIFGGTYDYDLGGYHYVSLGMVDGNTAAFEVVGATYDAYRVAAVFAGGSYSQGKVWVSSGGTPAPGGFYAYLNSTGTNVWLSWNPLAGSFNSFVLRRSDNNGGSYSQIAVLGTNATSFTDTNAIHTGSFSLSSTKYSIQATYPHGGMSAIATAMVSNTPSAPTELSVKVDSTGTNVSLAWTSASGDVTSYTIQRGVLNPSTGAYTYTTIGTVNADTTSFTVTGAINNYNDEWDSYQIVANHASSVASAPASTQLPSSVINLPPNASLNSKLNISAQLVRNENGLWHVMFLNIPTNAQTILLNWCWYDYFYNMGPQNGDINQDLSAFAYCPPIKIPVASLTNGVYVIPDWQLLNNFPNNWIGDVGYVQAMDANGNIGPSSLVGYLRYDSPRWVDGRQHLKENLLFQLQAATVSQPCARLAEHAVWFNPWFQDLEIAADANYVESSIFHSSAMLGIYATYVKMDDVWPFTANYELHHSLYDPNYNGPDDFQWQMNSWSWNYYGGSGSLAFQGSLDTVPAPAVLGSGQYWIGQSPSDLPAYTSGDYFHTQSGVNLFGLQYQGMIVHTDENDSPLILSPGGSTASTNVNCYYTKTAMPNLQLANYYFALINTPGTALPGGTPPQAYPLPCLTGFANTNQTGVLIASVGTPTVVGGWAKFAIQNGSADKFAYLGQYYFTNAYLMTNNIITANKTGVVSPYGDFFPTEPGVVAMTTMLDNDSSYAQGTGVVRVISLNVDANHDGTMDFTYQSPDFVSPGKPFRFWVNDSHDVGDYGTLFTGNDGIPDQGMLGNGVLKIHNKWKIHGRRDLVNYFPVCVNLGSLFQTNLLSAGIDPSDTSWQFMLSQADGALRFVPTGLTPTNYMDYLQDTNQSNNYNDAELTTVPASGVALPGWFLIGLASGNQNILLMEAWKSTTQPLVLTIYHNGNQVAQTSLPISITGVEQMFRHKNLMLDPNAVAPANRLTDASVPNEPDTINKNFVFIHGYNVDTNEARGVAADMFKRMYWSGSQAKFYAVTWEGAATKHTFPFRSRLTPNYHTNVNNAFLTAPYLANFITDIANSGPVVVAAHSLGNMLTLSAISDYGAPINQYFMLDAAVPIEAIDSSSSSTNMIPSTWLSYSNRVFASDWWQVWPTNDYRSKLYWNNRLGNIGNVDVYNFYSSGEEVLRTYSPDAPNGGWAIFTTTLSDIWPSGSPFGSYTWVWQEKGKGVCNEDWFVGSSHGGWRFPVNSYGDPNPVPSSTANALSNSVLQVTPVFTFNTSFDFGLVVVPHPDLTLTNAAIGGSYAAAHRNRILADAIPALSLPVGANPVPSFDNNHNKDMMTLENGWPQGRFQNANELNNWWHSDFHQMAYTFTYKLFNQFVTTGNLK